MSKIKTISTSTSINTNTWILVRSRLNSLVAACVLRWVRFWSSSERNEIVYGVMMPVYRTSKITTQSHLTTMRGDRDEWSVVRELTLLWKVNNAEWWIVDQVAVNYLVFLLEFFVILTRVMHLMFHYFLLMLPKQQSLIVWQQIRINTISFTERCSRSIRKCSRVSAEANEDNRVGRRIFLQFFHWSDLIWWSTHPFLFCLFLSRTKTTTMFDNSKHRWTLINTLR